MVQVVILAYTLVASNYEKQTMSHSSFIDDWNSIVPFKIKAADLEKPNEQFLYKSVLHSLKLMHYDLSSYENMYSEPIGTPTAKRELVARINYIYQLCSDSKQTSFSYVDLVKPTSKKVIHLLKIILNYLFYINMVKETVFEKTNNSVETYFQLNAKLNQEQTTNEENRIRANNMDRNIDDLKNQLPEINRQIKEQTQAKDSYYGKLASLRGNYQQLSDKMVLLKLEQTELMEQKVTNEEVCALKAAYESLECDIELQTECEKQLQTTNATHVQAIREMKPCTAQLEKLLQFEIEDCWKTVRNEVKKLKLMRDEAETKYNELLTLHTALNANYVEIEACLNERQHDLGAKQKLLVQRERTNDCEFDSHEQYVKTLQETNHLFEQILIMKRMEIAHLIEMSEESTTLINKTMIN